MPKYQVLRRVDAWVNYVAMVEAADPISAAELAAEDEGRFRWRQIGLSQFDAREFVTLDEAGEEIEATRTGDF